jgi:hypothetical protein
VVVRSASCLPLLAVVACTGTIGEPSTPTSSATAAVCAAGVDPGPVYLRRLTNAEYAHVVRDVLGVDAAAMTATFPQDLARTGFDNSSLEQTVSVLHAARYFDAAQRIATQVVTTPALRGRLGTCELSAGAPCLTQLIRATGRRLYRQPLTEDEVAELLAIATGEANAADGLQLTLEAMLNSPRFLFRAEVGTPENGRLKLTGFELATRLSFFLTGSSPDDALLAAAEAGELDDADGVARHARRLLATDAAHAALQRFAHQWFHVDLITTTARDVQAFPEFGPELKASLIGELDRLFDEHLFGEGSNFMDLYTRTSTFADARVAAQYGTPAPSTPFGRLELEGDRAGLLGTPGWLTITSRRSLTSPITRGVMFREIVLCDPAPPPMVNVSPPMPMGNESFADAEERHTADPACAGCHALIDPIGHGLERYDSLGKSRTTYPTGAPVRLTGRVAGLGLDDDGFGGARELGRLVAASDKGRACVVQHLFRYGLGRKERADDAKDECTLAQLNERFLGSTFHFPDLVVAFATSDAFRYRRPAP